MNTPYGYKDTFKIYYKNKLPRTVHLTAPYLSEKFELSDLYHPFLLRYVEFYENETTITIEFNLSEFIDSIAIVNSNFLQANIYIIDNQDILAYNGVLNRQGSISILRLPDKYACAKIIIELYGNEHIEIGYLFTGEVSEFSRFLPAPDMSININSKAETTSTGLTYGLKYPTTQNFKASFNRIDNEERLSIIEYISEVQFITPHIIAPYDAPEFPPFYGVLTDAGSFPKRNEPGFFFDTSLEYKETR